jgi:enediyne biosynthesis thioesterase
MHYEIRHTVLFEETNLLGNVYYVNHLKWQGRCREQFLKDHVPEILDELGRGLYLVTTRVSCEYLRELAPFDEVAIRMRLASQTQNRVTMHFEYWRLNTEGEELAARGEHQVAFLHKAGEQVTAASIPPALSEALNLYREDR